MAIVSTNRRDAVVLSGLVKSFGQVRAVKGVDIEIPSGQTVALLGPNGAGKSTTIDMLLGLTRPDAGRVLVFGQSPADAVKAGTIGGMLQTGALIRDLSVRELVTMVASLYPNPLGVDEVLHLTGISEVADRRTNKLSGGQVQRVRSAIALVADPELLVLDELTVALDVEMPGLDGLAAAAALTREVPECRVIILTTFGRAGYLRRAMESGAKGFIVKDVPSEQLAEAVRRVFAGELVVDPALAVATLAGGLSPLTARERDVLAAARNGATVADIAGRLFLSEGTVRNYLSAAIAKAGVRNRIEAVRVADEHGWL
jgi:two-component system, NarL family, response regulator DesR